MKLIFFLAVGIVLVVANVPTDEIREIQSEIVQLLNKNKNLTPIEQKELVKDLLLKLDDETRTKYELWISELQELEKEKAEKLKEIILRLSPESQQAFSRILMIQQSETLSTTEKAKKLEELSGSLPEAIKKEISGEIERIEILRQYAQSRSY